MMPRKRTPFRNRGLLKNCFTITDVYVVRRKRIPTSSGVPPHTSQYLKLLKSFIVNDVPCVWL